MPKRSSYRYAVVDVETTGLVHQDHALTEVAVVHVDERGITPVFHSLVDPHREIPAAITHLTGLSTALTKDAPSFADLAQEVAQALEGRIFVAHQVNFDYSFVSAALAKEGLKPPGRRLCTMRLARRATSGLRSFSLANLCSHFGIVNEAPHRALGDASATAVLLQKLSEIDGGRHVKSELERANRSAVLPPQLHSDRVNSLPEAPGVYYFYGSKGRRPIYIGKAKNLKRRILSHFTSAGSSRRKQLFQREVTNIHVEETRTEYAALLLEDAEIKAHMPVYNRAQKVRGLPFAVRCYTNRSGAQRLCIVRSAGMPDDLAFFGSAHEARNWILASMQVFGFHPSRAGLSPEYLMDNWDAEKDADGFEAFLQQAFLDRKASYLLIESAGEGPVPFVCVSQGRYRGFGTLSGHPSTMDFHEVEQAMRMAPESSAVRSVLRAMALDNNVTQIKWQ